jgi:putative transposase
MRTNKSLNSMPNYRRANAGGATYFFTVVTQRRRPILMRACVLDALRTAFRTVRQAKPFKIDAVVVLPDHIHTLWTLPVGDANYGARWGMIKRQVSKVVLEEEQIHVSDSMRARKEHGVWQRRFWEHLIRDENDYARHMDYIHCNPVKHGYVERPADWVHSSFHRCVEQGIYPLDWAAGGDIEGGFGE